VKVQNTAGTVSDAIDMQVVQAGDPPPPLPPRPSYDAATYSSLAFDASVLGIPLFSFDDGVAQNMVDGDATSQVTLTYAPVDALALSQYIWLTFPTAHEPVNNVHISSDPSCPLAAYDLYASDRYIPGAPSDTNPMWTKITSTVAATGTGEDDVTFPTQAVTHSAVVPTAASCGHVYWRYYHKIKEIRAMTEAFAPSPPPSADPVCPGN
jgi:hypothetical protein